MALKDQYMVAVVNEIDLSQTGITVAMGATLSSILECGGTAPSGLLLPAGFTACNITFMACKTPNGTFLPITNFDGTPFVLAGTASVWIPLLPAMFNSVTYLQLSCSMVQAAAVQLDTALAPYFQGIHA